MLLLKLLIHNRKAGVRNKDRRGGAEVKTLWSADNIFRQIAGFQAVLSPLTPGTRLKRRDQSTKSQFVQRGVGPYNSEEYSGHGLSDIT